MTTTPFGSPSRQVHPRVHHVLRHIRLHDLERSQISLVRLAEVAGLSPSRLMHVFTESLGMPLRAYVLGLRAQRAMDEMAHGRSVTEAAHIAGFADAPHLTRTLRRTVGMTPREIMHRLAERPVDRAAPGFAVIPQTRRA
ncbi:MAG TPA: helix-turn-helix transcriptional regulator [Vicinamibacterales bacterium]|nr:helix-turn-helix transcriptional regulator [Vicinamibacterales bacterium]